MSTVEGRANPTAPATSAAPGKGPSGPDWPRRLSPEARPTGTLVSLLGAQVMAEVRQGLRMPEYLVGVVGVPVLLYAMFGLPQAGKLLPAGTDVGAMMYASIACYGVVSLAIFTFGSDVANERGKGWLRRLRSTPMPMGVYFAGKLVMAMLFTVAILGLMLMAAVWLGHVAFDVGRLLAAAGILLLGAMALSTLGFALAFWARPKAASAVSNLVFLPLSFLSGFFFPVQSLPSVLQSVAPFMPTYHFGQLVWGAMAPAGDVEAFGALASGSTMSHVWPVVVTSLVFGVIAPLGYRRNVGEVAL